MAKKQAYGKKAAKWDELHRCRAFLEDIIELTNGHNVLQSCVMANLTAYLKDRAHKFTDKDVLRAAYRCRAMLNHLKECRRLSKAPPTRHKKLQFLVDRMVKPKSVDDDKKDDDDKKADEDEKAALCDEADDSESDSVKSMPMNKRSVECVEIDSSSADEYDFEKLMSAAPSSVPKPHAAHSAAPSAMSASSVPKPHAAQSAAPSQVPKPHAAQSAAPSAMSALCLARLVDDASLTEPIDPRAGNKNFGWVLRKPAAAPLPIEKSVSKHPASSPPTKRKQKTTPSTTPPKSAKKANVAYSVAYHKMLAAARQVHSEEDARQMARDAGKKATLELKQKAAEVAAAVVAA